MRQTNTADRTEVLLKLIKEPKFQTKQRQNRREGQNPSPTHENVVPTIQKLD